MEDYTNSGKSAADNVLQDGDYGFYGKGFSGYSHYMQAFKSSGGGGGGGCGCGGGGFLTVLAILGVLYLIITSR